MRDKNFEFYAKTDLSEYAGKWVSIVDQKIVSSGESAKEVITETKKKCPEETPFLAKVPNKIFI